MKKHETGKCPLCNEPIRPCGSAVVYHMECLKKEMFPLWYSKQPKAEE